MRSSFAVAMVIALFAGCAEPTGTNPFLETPDSGGDLGGTIPDAEMGCTGCLAADGACLDGDETAACGVGGVACSVCTGDQVCDGSGMCAEPPQCGPDNCAGCCDATDSCVGGADPGACGVGGASCETCAAGATCAEGTCELPCGAATCAGCCDGAGVCIEGQVDTACGRAGQACGDCTANAGACSEGQCVSTACADTCAGCCQGDTCVDPTTDAACGAAGEACFDCGQGRTCVAESCDVSPASLWSLKVQAGQVASSDADGASWDGFNGLPDPYVRVSASNAAGAVFEGTSSTVDNSLAPVWDETVLTDVPAEALLLGLTLVLNDEDTVSDDEVCTITVSLDAMSSAFDGTLQQSNCPDPMLGGVSWQLVPN